MSGHEWTNAEMDKCGLCGDKDWMADKFCSKNPKYKVQHDEWVKEEKLTDQCAMADGPMELNNKNKQGDL